MTDTSTHNELSEGDQFRADSTKDGLVLDDWSVNTDFLAKNDVDRDLPWDDVEASRRNRRLQKNHRESEGLRTHFAEARPCPQCQSSIDGLSWFYFRSPKETWAMECSVAGWMAVCDCCHLQVNFFIEAVS
jgi:hypothetical protein